MWHLFTVISCVTSFSHLPLVTENSSVIAKLRMIARVIAMSANHFKRTHIATDNGIRLHIMAYMPQIPLQYKIAMHVFRNLV